MGRPLRLEFAGAIYHVTSRGDRQEAIFRNDGDRHAWQRILASVCTRFRWNIHAFCQMGNHYHLVVETLENTLSRGMRQLNGEYSRHFNFRNATVGHLFQGRYKAILVQRQTYLLALSRYVVLNPVRAGMVATPSGWPWSSYAMTCSDVRAPEWLETDWLLSQFGAQRDFAVRAYREFVAAGRGLESPMADLRHQFLLGDAASLKRPNAGATLVDKTETSRSQKKAIALTLHEYSDRFDDRHEAMARAYLDGAYTMAEVGEHFSVHYKTVSRAVRNFEAARCTNVRPDTRKMSKCQTSHFVPLCKRAFRKTIDRRPTERQTWFDQQSKDVRWTRKSKCLAMTRMARTGSSLMRWRAASRCCAASVPASSS